MSELEDIATQNIGEITRHFITASGTLEVFPAKLVTQSNFRAPQNLATDDYALLLNPQEMFIACTLQTLRGADLILFLPGDIPRPCASLHLNVALPIFQGFTDKEGEPLTHQTIVDALRSPNSDIRQWAKSRRDSFKDLRNSPDP